MLANPKWIEIQDQLLTGISLQSRPDIVLSCFLSEKEEANQVN